MNNYHLKNRTYQFILLQNKAYHDNNKSNTKPLVRSRPQSANQVRKSSSSLGKILRSSKNYDQSFLSNSKIGPLSTSNQNFMNNSNQISENNEQEMLNYSLNQSTNTAIQRPSSASTDYFYRKYRSLSSYNSTINKENNRMSANTTLQVQPLSFVSTPMSNNQFRTTPNSMLNNSNAGLFSSKSKSSQKPSNKSLNSGRRKIEQKRIEESNLQLLKSLSQVKPQVKSKRELDKDFVQVQKYKSSLSNFKGYGVQKPKIVIMNKEYLAPILSSYIDKKNIDGNQSPKHNGFQNGQYSNSNFQFQQNQQFQQQQQPHPPKRLFRRTQNHYNNGFVYDDDDDTVNIKNYLTSNTYMQQNPYLNENSDQYDNHQKQQQYYQTQQNQRIQEEIEYRKAVFESHYSNGQYQSSHPQDSEQNNQQMYLQQEYDQMYDGDNDQYNTQQSPQFNQQIQYNYEQQNINEGSDMIHNENDQNGYDYEGDEDYQQNQEGDDEVDYYEHLQDRRKQQQQNQNVMLVRDLVNQMDSDQLQPNKQFNSKDVINSQKINNQEQDDSQGYQYVNQYLNAQKPNKNQNYDEENEEDLQYYDDQEEVEEELENGEYYNNNTDKQKQQLQKDRVQSQQQNNGLYMQNQDNQYDEDFEEVYEDDIDLDEQDQKYYQKSNNNQSGRAKGNQMNLQLNQQNYGNDQNFQDEEIIEEVDDEESNTKSNKVFSIRNSKGYIKNSNSQFGKSEHELSDHQLQQSNKQSMFNTPSFIQD